MGIHPDLLGGWQLVGECGEGEELGGGRLADGGADRVEIAEPSGPEVADRFPRAVVGHAERRVGAGLPSVQRAAGRAAVPCDELGAEVLRDGPLGPCVNLILPCT